MPTPNYSFEKRRKELEKKNKKEEKRKRKLEAAQTPGNKAPGDADSSSGPG
jgi:hypothetical protein